MEPLQENGEELIDDRGRNVTQQRIDEESGLDSSDGAERAEPEEEWFDGADPDAEPV